MGRMDHPEKDDPRRRDRPHPGTVDDYRDLKDELERIAADESKTEEAIEAELRREHFGHEPERPPAWKTPEGGEPDGS